MIGLKPREAFIKATFQLAKSNPSAWMEFVEAYNQYTLSELERATAPSSEQLAIVAGMNRRMVDLRNDFRDIEVLARKVGVV